MYGPSHVKMAYAARLRDPCFGPSLDPCLGRSGGLVELVQELPHEAFEMGARIGDLCL